MPVNDQPRGTVATDTGEAIAVIGMAGRFPGADTVDDLWTLLRDGTDAIEEIPADRYDVEAVYDRTPRTRGRTVSRWGGLLHKIDEFDAEFFGIAPREAAKMDPQQRLLLEVTYEALEDAGVPLSDLIGSDTGVYIGQAGGDYWHMQYATRDSVDLYGMTGAGFRAVMSGRLSYAFDLRGPSYTVDTACSSGLVAVHNAVQALRLGECRMAIAGAVALVLGPEEGIGYSSVGMLAKDGRCKFGDASGDGFVRSDGIGSVILKPLSQALADGNRIRAVVRGSAVGNDGRSGGYLVAPGVMGQRDVLARAYADAGVSPADVDYVEAHGTGTAVGDPVELEALADVLGKDRPADRPALVGSIKTNIGHAEAAAGIAGLIKAVLCLEKRVVPPSLHFNDPNPAVPWATLPLTIATRNTPLPDNARPALACVNSFGISGTNAHLVLEEHVPDPAPVEEKAPDRAELLTLSAATPEALKALATSVAEFLTAEDSHSPSLRDICYSAALHRSHLDSRLALPAVSHEQAALALSAFAQDDPEPLLSFSQATDSTRRPRVVFVFPGQGSQWVGMGRELLGSEPVFTRAMQECDAAIQAETGWSVIDLLRNGPEERFTEADVIQPVLWALEIALAQVWRSWGIEPDVVIGHSMGESAAAYVAGALSIEDAAAVICRRSRLAKRLAGHGAMAWVALPADEAEKALAGHEDTVAVAAANSPTSTLLSGDPDDLIKVLAALEAREIPTRLVRVDFASHCPQMDGLRDDLIEALKDLVPRRAAIPIHSTLLGEVIDGSGMDAGYWARNIREPVDFVGAVRQQLHTGDTVFIEVSPHPVLVGGIKETGRAAGHDETTAVGSLRRDEGERVALLAAAGSLHTAGVPIDLAAIVNGGRFVPLPSYPWQRTRYWLPDSAPAQEAPAPGTPATATGPAALASGPQTDVAATTGTQGTDVLDNWMYDLRWKALPRTASAAASSQRGTWLVFSDSGPTGRAVVKALEAEGEDPIVVTAAATYQAGADRFRVNPAKPEHYAALLDEVTQLGPLRGIVHLWSLDAVAGLDATGKEIERAQLLSCGSVIHLVQALDTHDVPGNPGLWLITQHAQRTGSDDRHIAPFQAPLWGLGRTLAAEQPDLRTRLIDVDRSPKTVPALVTDLLAPDDEDQAALREGARSVARLVTHTSADGSPAAAVRLSTPAPGVIDDLALTPASPALPADGEVAIRVSHAALTYADLLVALDLYPGQADAAPTLGWECSGIVTSIGEGVADIAVGDQVIALVKGAMASHVVAKAVLTAPKPAGITLAEAATLPMSYLTAYHALHDLARIEKGDRVLIHSATGGIGSAAINVARWMGAELYATAGSPDKRKWLAELGIRHVSDSRSLEFATAFGKSIGEGGFNAIVNTLTGDAIPANLSMMAPHGHYLELSKRDIVEDAALNLGVFAGNLSFHAIAVSHMIQHRPDRAGAVLRAIADLVEKGILAPLPHREFSAAHAAQAFHLMAQSRHIGKIILAFPDEVIPSTPASTPPLTVSAHGTYLITGGTGGIGARLANWLVDQGARTLLLTGRTPLPDPATAAPNHPRAARLAVLRDLIDRGVDVHYTAVDVADYPAMRALLDERGRQGKGPLRGILHTAGTIDYAPVRDMTPDQLTSALAAKVQGTWNLHRLARGLPLDMFVLFSSISSILSSPLLSGYAAGNAFLDALAQHRLTEGVQVTSVNWGFWDHVGMAARKEAEDGRSPLPQGMSGLSPDEALAMLGDILTDGTSHIAVFHADWPSWARAYPEAARVPLLRELLVRSGRAISPIPPETTPSDAPAASRKNQPAQPTEVAVASLPVVTEPTEATFPSKEALPTPTPAPQVVADPAVVEALKKAVAEVLGLNQERLNVTRPLNRMGMDSMMAVQLRSRIERQFRIKLPMIKILKGGSINTVAQVVTDATSEGERLQ